MSESTVTPAEQSFTEATGISMATETPAEAPKPAAPKTRRSTSRAATAGRKVVAQRTAAKGKPAAKPAAKRGPKVSTPAAPKAAKVTGPVRKHPFTGTGCLVIVGKVGDPLSGKVVFQSDSGFIDESMAQAIAAGKVTQEQVTTGAAYVAPLRNLWQRV